MFDQVVEGGLSSCLMAFVLGYGGDWVRFCFSVLDASAWERFAWDPFIVHAVTHIHAHTQTLSSHIHTNKILSHASAQWHSSVKKKGAKEISGASDLITAFRHSISCHDIDS